MDNPRPEKVAVVDEVRQRLERASASVVSEYRGLTVAQLAELRRSLAPVGAEYKIFKNTLVRRAVDGTPYAPLEELLTGPTALTFVHGDVSATAKALRDFSRTHSQLVVKGGLLDGALVSPAQLGALADLPPRDILLSRLAGAIAAPMTQLAGLLQALPRSLAYGLKALVDQRGGVPGAAEEAPEEVPAGARPDAPGQAPEEASAGAEPAEAADGAEPAEAADGAEPAEVEAPDGAPSGSAAAEEPEG